MHYAIPVILGISVVLQGIINRKVGGSIGLAATVFVNAIVFLIFSAIVFLASYWKPMLLPEFLRVPPMTWKTAISENSVSFAQYWIPGFCGFLIVMGAPIAIQSIGPSKTFVIMVAAQIAFSFAIEIANQAEWHPLKLLGASLAILGAYLVASN